MTDPAEQAPPADEPRSWAGVVELLAEDRENLVEDFLQRLSALGNYTDGMVPDSDLRQSATETFDMLTRRIAGVPLPDHLRDLSTRLGVRRARQGVAREHLLEAVRLDFRVLWAGLVRAGGPGSSQILVLHAEEILTTVEQYISDVQAAFLEERAALERDSRAAAAQAFSRLLNSGDRAAAVASEVAGTLGLPEHGTFDVAFVVPPPEREQRPAARVRERGGGLAWEFDDGVALVRETARTPWPDPPPGASGGLVARVRGLAAVPASVEAARVLSGYAAPGGFVREEDVWSAIAHDQLRGLIPGFGRDRVERFERLDGDSRARLLETLAHYAATGSVKATAEALYCHRNTVVNRLQAFRETTGLDLTVPAEAARALVLFSGR
ncbi:helix-turn-helix domain-containing protein [Nocardiopsis sp. RV163]|uniref:helix-turn-helix domain-containing protein n=1 Tax=Nocardiopsis sp. RV163 TaxID=1661388 RepID=UPI00064C222E|nr:helix-turn-helix domain-containing protein [Nocardiopsis sp. RV163]